MAMYLSSATSKPSCSGMCFSLGMLVWLIIPALAPAFRECHRDWNFLLWVRAQSLGISISVRDSSYQPTDRPRRDGNAQRMEMVENPLKCEENPKMTGTPHRKWLENTSKRTVFFLPLRRYRAHVLPLQRVSLDLCLCDCVMCRGTVNQSLNQIS